MTDLIAMNKETEFSHFPLHMLFAVVESRSGANRVLRALTDKGFAEDQVTAMFGDQGLKALDPEGEFHGGTAKVYRKMQHLLTDTGMIFDLYAEAMRQGQYVVGVHADGDEGKGKALEVIKDHGGREIAYFGLIAVERLD